ncbi:MAG: precorrin-6y C5,15-methyltransferase (decarboxylating) subunit CbiE [Planctomycetota bacterium]|nr:precorrin-6y C5,15-methyltransferase (decarboxylating) subunit CbiE [Planctomycetota bacterium]
MDKIHILGIGDEGPCGLTEYCRAILEKAELIIANPSNLQQLGELEAELITLKDDLEEIVSTLKSNRNRKIVILSPGDPLFFGTTRYLCEALGKDAFEIIPHVSMMQLAFARIRESWDDAFFSDLSSRPLESLFDRIRFAEKVGLFTTPEVTPAKVAKMLMDQRADYFRAFVCEDIASPKERITECSLSQLCDLEFDSLNVLILVRSNLRPELPAMTSGLKLFGNADETFLQSQPKRGLLTPAEVRCIALGSMGLQADSIVWDVGAGSGSLAIEAARLCTSGSVYAIEMDSDDFQLLQSNSERFQISNIRPVLGEAPAAWSELPDPDAIFIGGTGRSVGEISGQAFSRLKEGGTIVIHVAGMTRANDLFYGFHRDGFQPEISLLNFSRGHLQFDSLRFDAVNPSFLISCHKFCSH